MPTPIRRSVSGSNNKKQAKKQRVVEDGHVLTAVENRKIPVGILVGAWWISFYETGKADLKEGWIAFQVSMVLSLKADGTPNTYSKTSQVEFKFPKEGTNILHLEFLAKLLEPFNGEVASKNEEISDNAMLTLLDPNHDELGLAGDALAEAEEVSAQVYKYAPTAVQLVEAVNTGLEVRDEWNQSRQDCLDGGCIGEKDDPYHSKVSLRAHEIAEQKLAAKAS